MTSTANLLKRRELGKRTPVEIAALRATVPVSRIDGVVKTQPSPSGQGLTTIDHRPVVVRSIAASNEDSAMGRFVRFHEAMHAATTGGTLKVDKEFPQQTVQLFEDGLLYAQACKPHHPFVREQLFVAAKLIRKARCSNDVGLTRQIVYQANILLLDRISVADSPTKRSRYRLKNRCTSLLDCAALEAWNRPELNLAADMRAGFAYEQVYKEMEQLKSILYELSRKRARKAGSVRKTGLKLLNDWLNPQQAEEEAKAAAKQQAAYVPHKHDPRLSEKSITARKQRLTDQGISVPGGAIPEDRSGQGEAGVLPMSIHDCDRTTSTVPPTMEGNRGVSAKYSGSRVIIPRAVRLLVTGRTQPIFARRARERGGSVLIDCSGSMQLQATTLFKCCESIPAATVAFYGEAHTGSNTDGRWGQLHVFAHDGLRGDAGAVHKAVEVFRSGNDVDLFALLWLLEQDRPHILVSDLGFCGGPEYQASQAIVVVANEVKNGNLVVVKDLTTLTAYLKHKGTQNV